MPEWCRDYFTPLAVFGMRVPIEELPGLEHAYVDYLRAWVGLATVIDTGRPDSPALREYKDHHIAHTPGRTYLSRVFGSEWTEEFLRTAMYA